MLPPHTSPPPRGGAGRGTLGARPRPGAPRTSSGRREGQGAGRVMPETELSPLPEEAVALARPVPGPRRPVSRWPRAAGAWLLLLGSRPVPGGGERASWGRREGSASAAVQEGGEGHAGERRGTHSPPHTAVRESQSSRSACTQRRRSMPLLCRAAAARARGRGGRAGWAPRRGKARAADRACVRARSSRGSLAAPRAGRLPCSLAASRSAASLSRRGAAPPSWPQRAAPGTAASSFQESGCSAAAPTARGPDCQRECSPLSPGAAFCSLWLGREPTWSCGHREGWRGGQEEGEGASLPHRPPPSTHSAAPARAREGTSRWPHNKGGTAAQTTHNRSQDNARLAGGQKVLET